jgi:hypothetical protein
MWKKPFLIFQILFVYLQLSKMTQNQKFKFKQKYILKTFRGHMIPHPDKAYRGG